MFNFHLGKCNRQELEKDIEIYKDIIKSLTNTVQKSTESVLMFEKLLKETNAALALAEMEVKELLESQRKINVTDNVDTACEPVSNAVTVEVLPVLEEPTPVSKVIPFEKLEKSDKYYDQKKRKNK